jgi:hypothetical protein
VARSDWEITSLAAFKYSERNRVSGSWGVILVPSPHLRNHLVPGEIIAEREPLEPATNLERDVAFPGSDVALGVGTVPV